MTDPAVAAQVHQTLDVDGHFAAQITFDRHPTDLVPDLFQVAIGEILDLLGEGHSNRRTDFLRSGTADPINGGQTDFGVLVLRNVDTGDTCHGVNPLLTVISPDAACDAGRCKSPAPRPCDG
jgi:hypothetical protein